MVSGEVVGGKVVLGKDVVVCVAQESKPVAATLFTMNSGDTTLSNSGLTLPVDDSIIRFFSSANAVKLHGWQLTTLLENPIKT